MAVFLAANVEGSPFAVPVEGDRLPAFILIVQLLKMLVLDDARAVFVKEAEGNFILGVGLGEQVFEGAPIVDVDLTFSLAIGDAEEDCVLFAFDFVLRNWAKRISF